MFLGRLELVQQLPRRYSPAGENRESPEEEVPSESGTLEQL